MTIITGGDIVDTAATDGDFWVGNTGIGSLAVDAGSVKSITAANNTSAAAEARLWVGRTATGNGTVTVNGAATVLEVVSGGRADAGATAQIGRGGTGSLTVDAGGAFRVVDTVGTAYNWSTGDGAEAINVGRDAGGDGTLNVNNGAFQISGTGAFMNVGRGGGTGVANFIAGSTLSLSSTIAAADVGIQIGRSGQGLMLLSASSATLTGGGAAATATEDYGAGISVGRDAGGNGTLALESGASLSISGDSNLAGTPGSYAALQIGRDGGTGAMTLSGSTVTLNNSPEGALLYVGRNAASGTTTNGTLQLTASTITLDSTGNANFGIGRGTGTIGTVTLGGGSTITAQGDLGAHLQIGTTNNNVGSTGGTGTLNINGVSGTGGVVTIQSDNAGTSAVASIGQFGGTGTVNLDGGTLRMQGVVNAFMQIGYQVDFAQPGGIAANSAGTGSLILTNGAKFYMADGVGTSGLRLGGGVGTATMEIRSGSVANLDEGDSAGSTFVTVGSGQAGAGVATLLVSGASSRLEGVSGINVGHNTFDTATTGGNGRLIVENGGTVVAETGIRIGTGGRLSGDGGTLQVQPGNWVTIADDGLFGDTGGAIQTLTVVGNLGIQNGANARFDISSAAQDRVSAQVSSGNSGAVFLGKVDFDLNVLGGYKFTAGESRTLISSGTGTFVGLDFNAFPTSTVAINGQHADFSYYLGALSDGSTFGLTALNSGTSGGTSTLDFGASSTVGASFAHNAVTNAARVTGGTSAGAGGLTVGVDIVRGTGVSDTFDASQSSAAMVLDGRGGNDTLLGGGGDDQIFGGDGIDTIYAGTGDDYIEGGAGAYSVLVGGAGQDTIYGGAGNDYMVGDDGNDTLVGLGGQDSLYGGAGSDYIVAGDGPGSVVDGGAGANTLWGANGNDYMVGGELADLIIGGAGSDYVFGNAGNDTIYGGNGTDYIYSNAGNDFIWSDDVGAPQSTDYIYAGGGTGVDTVADFKAGAGGDVLVVAAAASGIGSFAQLMANATQVGVYTVITLGADQVYLYNVQPFQLTEANALFL